MHLFPIGVARQRVGGRYILRVPSRRRCLRLVPWRVYLPPSPLRAAGAVCTGPDFEKDKRDAAGSNLYEHLAGVNDLLLAQATFDGRRQTLDGVYLLPHGSLSFIGDLHFRHAVNDGQLG